MLSTSKGFLLGVSVQVRRARWWVEAERAPGAVWPGASSSLPAPGLRLAWLGRSPRVPLLTWSCCPSSLGSTLDRAKRGQAM